MKEGRKRLLTARLLLPVFVAMLAATTLHVHSEAAAAAWDACYECVNHLPHGGHLSAHALSIHDCVLCQLMSVAYVPALVLVLIGPLQANPALHPAGPNACHALCFGKHPTRAPPSLS